MKISNCKRCGRILENTQSIEDGYGPTCLKITKLYNSNNNKIEQVDFLGIEINMIKRELQLLRISPLSKKYHDDPIERIKQDEEDKIIEPIIKKYREAFRECVNELRGVLETRKNEMERKEKEDQKKNEIEILEVMTS